MGLWFVQYACVVLEWHCCIGAFVHMWFICVSLIVVVSIKMSLKLYLFINVCIVDDRIFFVKEFILKSPIVEIKQCEGIFCIMFLKMEFWNHWSNSKETMANYSGQWRHALDCKCWGFWTSGSCRWKMEIWNDHKFIVFSCYPLKSGILKSQGKGFGLPWHLGVNNNLNSIAEDK